MNLICEREKSRDINDAVWEAAIALNRIATYKVVGERPDQAAIERCAQLLADLPQDGLESLLRRKNGKSNTNTEISGAEADAL